MAAQDKGSLERQRSRAVQEVAELRESWKSMQAAEESLSELLQHLESENKKHRDEFNLIAYSVPEDKEHQFTFEKIIQHLKDAIKTAHDWQISDALRIHPQLRNDTEKQLAETEPRRSDPFGLQNFPAREKSPEIDHWFIGAAAECLDRCCDRHSASKRIKLPRYDYIISGLFKIAFGDESRNAENVRRELGRQKKSGRPRYINFRDYIAPGKEFPLGQ